VHGTATVIARHSGDEYAFYRGTTFLGTPAQQEQERAAAGQELNDADKQGESNAYFKNVLDMNRSLQNKRQQQLKSEVEKSRKGLQLNKVE